MAKKEETKTLPVNFNEAQQMSVAVVNKPTLWDAVPAEIGAKRISSIQIVNAKEMPIGAAVSGYIVAFVDGKDKTIKTPLIHLRKEDNSEFQFPLATVIETALEGEFGEDFKTASVGKFIWIKKTAEKESKRHHGRSYNVFELYVK
jgi:hypothetical protein